MVELLDRRVREILGFHVGAGNSRTAQNPMHRLAARPCHQVTHRNQQYWWLLFEQRGENLLVIQVEIVT